MSTTPHLPPPQTGAPLPGAAGPAYAPAAYAPPPAAIPPMPPPSGRSTGFWVGVTAAITGAIVVALLVGFFIGRGTRLSNDEVQGKLTQQQQADLIVQQKALNDQKSSIMATQRRLVARVSSKAEARGRREG